MAGKGFAVSNEKRYPRRIDNPMVRSEGAFVKTRSMETGKISFPSRFDGTLISL
jgi:hypothetical protein